jgi:tRNA threonylcarbamoyladenosine biosynthesis protein TsaB
MSAAESSPKKGWLLALHSSSEILGVALQPLGQPEVPAQLQSFAMGRELANSLLPCVEAVLPASEWIHLARLAVAIGPGGFTGTRLTVAMARTLCQQLGLPLDGISSFHLIARRLFSEAPRAEPLAGLYGADASSPGGVVELQAPRLYRTEGDLTSTLGHHGQLPAQPQLPADAAQLLVFSQEAARRGVRAPWASVVPLYPTSPVELRP